MILLGEIYFFIWLTILALPAIYLGIKEKNIKFYGFLVSVIFIFFAIGCNYVSGLYLLLFCIYQLVLAISTIAIITKVGRNRQTFWIPVLLAILPLCVYKISSFINFSILGFIGISYLTFKAVQVIIEIYDGLIKEIKIFDFLYFLIFFPCLSSGPIDRSRRFTDDLNSLISRSQYLDNLGTGLLYIMTGATYKFCFAALLYQGVTYLNNYNLLWATIAYMYVYGLYLFFDFAGYSKMAIGISYIFGINTPSNFNKPFLSTDIKDFWNRWHITLSHWFRDFLFSRFMMASIRGKWFNNKLVGASIALIINMLVMGIWHGLGTNFILYGFYHGVLLAITEIYQKKSKFYKKHKKNSIYKFVSWFLTFNFVMFGFLIFSGKLI